MIPDLSTLTHLLRDPQSLFGLPNFQIYQLSFFTILVFFLIGLRVTLSLVGRKYSAFRLFLGPFVLVLLVSYNYYYSYIVSSTISLTLAFRTEFLIIPIFLIVGIALGVKIGRKDRVFVKKGRAYYRSSVMISLMWALSFLIKMGVVTYLPLIPAGISIGLVFSAILDITTGLILGEAMRIFGTYRREYAEGAFAPV